MMTTDNRPVVSNLDFDSVKQDIINHFKTRPELKDYEYTGSTINLFIDMLAYTAHYAALTSNFQFNEMFLDSAVLRSSVVSIAKRLNYHPKSYTASNAKVRLVVTKTNDNTFEVIPAGSSFTARSDNQSFNFFTTQDYLVQYKDTDPNGTQKTVDVDIYEGRLNTERFIQKDTIAPARFAISQPNIDTDRMVVSVNGVKYQKVIPSEETLFQIDSNSLVYFVEEDHDGYQNIIFGSGVLGKELQPGDEVLITYLTTSGPEANNISNFSSYSLGNFTTYVDQVIQSSAGGAYPESVGEIKANAPKWFQSQYRAVTENDYEVVLKHKYPDVQSIKVYGGETVNQPGKVFVVIKPKSTTTLSAAVKNSLKNDILETFNVVTVTPVILDPTYIEINLKSTVIYDKNTLLESVDVLKTKVFSLMSYFNNNRIHDFSSKFLESNFSYEIKDLTDGIVGSNSRVSLSTTVNASNGYLNSYELDFGNAFYHPEPGFKASEGGVVSSSLFYRRGQTVMSGFDDDGNGNLRMYDYYSGNVKKYVNSAVGTIDYASGVINLNSTFVPVDGDITFTVHPESFDIIASRNNILQISLNNSSINIVEKNNTNEIKSVDLTRSL